MFLKAQQNFEKNRLFQHKSYVADLLENYGDHGKKIALPDVSKSSYERGLAYREQEKQYYVSLTEQMHSMRGELEQMQGVKGELAYVMKVNGELADELEAMLTKQEISRLKSIDDPGNHRSDSPHRDNVDESEVPEKDSTADVQQPSTRRPLADTPDATEPDVGGSSTQHNPEE